MGWHNFNPKCASTCVPADTKFPVKSCAVRCCAWFEVAGVEVCQGVVCKAMHGACLTVQILIDHTRNELRCEGNDKSLE